MKSKETEIKKHETKCYHASAATAHKSLRGGDRWIRAIAALRSIKSTKRKLIK